MNTMHSRMIKKMRIAVFVLVALATIGAMFWYVNTYIYKFLAASPTVKITLTPFQGTVEKNTIKPNEEFTIRFIVENQNIDGLDLYLTYDNTKVQYLKEYAQTYVKGDGYTVVPPGYFDEPVFEDIIDANGKKQLNVTVIGTGAARQKHVELFFKFKALNTTGTAAFTLETKSVVTGVDDNNTIHNFEKDLAAATTSVTIGTGESTITPSVSITPQVTETQTPPWINTNYSTTTVWGIVQTVDETGKGIDNAYWRKDATVCPEGSFSDSAVTNVSGMFVDKCYSAENGSLPYFATNVSFSAITNEPGTSDNIWNLVKAAPGNIYPWTNRGPTAGWESYESNFAYICNTKYCWVYNRNESKWNNDGAPFDMQTDPEYTTVKASTAATGGPKVGVLPWSENGPTAAWSWHVTVSGRALTETILCNGNYCWRYLRYPNGETGSAWRDNGNAIYLPTFNSVWADPRVVSLWAENGITVAWTDPVNRRVTLCNHSNCRSIDYTNFTWRFNGDKISPFPSEVTEFNAAWTSPVTNIASLCVQNSCWQYNMTTGTYASTPTALASDILPGGGASRNITYELKNIPEGYECAGYERRLRNKSDGSPMSDAKGDGCTATLKIDVQPASSQYENSHFIWFKLKKSPETTSPPISIAPSDGIPTPSDGIPTPPPSKVDAQVTMKIRLQGVKNPKPENRKQMVEVVLGLAPRITQKVEFTYEEGGIWVGKIDYKDVYQSQGSGDNYSFFVKGPKHIGKRICDMNPQESLPGTYKCKSANIKLEAGENVLDFTNIILLAGDLPIQDRVVNSLDYSFLRQNFGSTDAEVLLRGDLNFDGIVHTDDHTLIKTALEFKYDDE